MGETHSFAYKSLLKGRLASHFAIALMANPKGLAVQYDLVHTTCSKRKLLTLLTTVLRLCWFCICNLHCPPFESPEPNVLICNQYEATHTHVKFRKDMHSPLMHPIWLYLHKYPNFDLTIHTFNIGRYE